MPKAPPRRTASEWSHSRTCNVDDFSRPELLPYIRGTYAHLVDRWPDFPAGREDRKVWEVAMAARSLTELGAVRPDSEVLGVGAGREGTIFWLTNLVRRVFATDLYLTPGDWERTAQPAMFTDPGSLWPNPFDPRHLVVQHMNGLDLKYDDETFDGVFSSSSIEHFGLLAEIRRAVEEMCRVLKPGGIASISTEIRVRGSSTGFPDARVFGADELKSLVGGLPWDIVGPLETDVTARSMATVVDFYEAADDVRSGRGHYTTYPHVILGVGETTWTSVHLALRKRSHAGDSVRRMSSTARSAVRAGRARLPDVRVSGG